MHRSWVNGRHCYTWIVEKFSLEGIEKPLAGKKRKGKLNIDTGLISQPHDLRDYILKCLNKGQIVYTQAMDREQPKLILSDLVRSQGFKGCQLLTSELLQQTSIKQELDFSLKTPIYPPHNNLHFPSPKMCMFDRASLGGAEGHLFIPWLDFKRQGLKKSWGKRQKTGIESYNNYHR